MPEIRSRFARSRFAARGLAGVATVVAGIALTTALAGPASADPTPTAPPPAQSQFESQTSISAASPAATSANGSRFATAAATAGKRQTFTRGGALAWSSDTFQWFWSASSMTSSTASQAAGYIAPNVVKLEGVKRTLATSSEHLWQASAAVGAQVPTPWSPVVIYSDSITDYFTLTANKLTHTS